MAVASKTGGWRKVLDSTTSELGVYSAGQKRFEIGNASLTTEGANTAALLHGIGTTTTPVHGGTSAGKNFMGYWMKTTATSGDTRGLYLRLYLAGTGGDGEALRAYTTINGVVAAGGSHGGHISLNMDATGSTSGLAVGLRATLDAAAASRTLTGTLACLMVESNFGTGNTMPTNTSFIRAVDTGAVVCGNLLEMPTVASGGIFAVHTTQVMTHSIRIISAAGTKYYLMVTDAATNRTGGA